MNNAEKLLIGVLIVAFAFTFFLVAGLSVADSAGDIATAVMQPENQPEQTMSARVVAIGLFNKVSVGQTQTSTRPVTEKPISHNETLLWLTAIGLTALAAYVVPTAIRNAPR